MNIISGGGEELFVLLSANMRAAANNLLQLECHQLLNFYLLRQKYRKDITKGLALNNNKKKLLISSYTKKQVSRPISIHVYKVVYVYTDMYTIMFTSTQISLHTDKTACMHFCRYCIQMRLQVDLCLRDVYKFTVLFYLVTVIVEFRNLL